MKQCQCWILNYDLLGNVYPDFCKQGLGTLRRFNRVDTALRFQSCTDLGLELPGCRPVWIEDRMILAWPAKDHWKISRVTIHTSKTRWDCPFKGLGERVFSDYSFSFVRVDLIMSTAECVDEENSPSHKFPLILLSQSVYTPLICSLTATSMFPCSSIRDKYTKDSVMSVI